MSKSKKELSFAEEVEQSLRKKFRKNIWCKFTKAINEYELVKPGDRIAVCISGGKDSMLLAKLFQELKRHNKFDFEVKFLVMDPGYSPVNRQVIEENARRLEIPIEIFESDIFESVFNIEKSPCYLCARMRRGYLYSHAQKMGCNKIALGHHYDDVIETILMGMLSSESSPEEIVSVATTPSSYVPCFCSDSVTAYPFSDVSINALVVIVSRVGSVNVIPCAFVKSTI